MSRRLGKDGRPLLPLPPPAEAVYSPKSDLLISSTCTPEAEAVTCYWIQETKNRYRYCRAGQCCVLLQVPPAHQQHLRHRVWGVHDMRTAAALCARPEGLVRAGADCLSRQLRRHIQGILKLDLASSAAILAG